ncbi:FAD-dependent oxidoreductase [Mucilaginibacter sp. FT3.2]|uniref:FAD-dependent oxidoreductase n=1 Tax=Mucilaginibacter sp. FT3.2 TaxID=2723090 RepID=UPI00160F6127|nr:FAD-dependent oxidoreductase [Mucilaginibacter sp. FT3.2]MBB6232792.1 protoporphyrinogen oxidase [Mucilaginibacter sp. FT3.2]
MKIAVIGAGAAGMTAAYSLVKHNAEVDVYEASSRIGGLAGTLTLWNQKVDIGPHRFFSTDKKVNAVWLEVVGNDYEMVDRLTRIYYKNKFYSYPIRIFNALRNLGIFEAGQCVFSYLSERIVATKQDGSFETWVQHRFGKRLFEVFFKNYTEKLWGISCKELDADFAAQRIKKLSLYESLKNAVLNGNGNKHKTLVDQFAYPLGGSGMVYERMADAVTKSGNNVYLNTPVYRIITSHGKVLGIELEDGTFREYDHVISSMPYTVMVKRLTEVPEQIKYLTGCLKFRNTVLVYLHINSTSLFPDNWLYIHSADLQMGRVTNFRNWIPNLYNNEEKTIIAIEYWCNDDDPMWGFNDEDFIKLASGEIVRTGLVNSGLIENGYVHRIHRSYPVYSKGYKEILKPIEEYVSSIENLSVIGRYGAFKYNNQDHSILMGLLAAENIINNANHQLCDINTDYETYQESFIITKTGLYKQ